MKTSEINLTTDSVHIDIDPRHFYDDDEDADSDTSNPHRTAHYDQPPSYQEVTETKPRISQYQDGSPPGGVPGAVDLPLPPLYEDVVRQERPFASHPEDAREWQDPSAACDEMFGKCITYWRILVFLGNIAGIVFLMLHFYEYDIPWAGVTGGILFGVFYLLYLIETFCYNSNMKFLTNSVMVTDINGHVDSVRAGEPSVLWRMECYHYETRTRTVTTGTGTSRSTRTETYTVKVTTWTGQLHFQFSYWDDVSDPRQLDTIGIFKQTRIKFSKQFVLSDGPTREAFERQRDGFVLANRWRDAHHNLTETFDIVGYEPAVLVSTTDSKPSFRDSLVCPGGVLANGAAV
ncbi:transmembrane protein 151 homolog [Paramacrobiotus metropolitanus]|uniref:transmembrane protein 151 homolog n=1 Tax=Paramacrobiotus metropolitanus TaxID=2943436 RepID=UPI002445E717|nr:transmembrane protein 151 homolog [Paramacrobiotus metropolitanus]